MRLDIELCNYLLFNLYVRDVYVCVQVRYNQISK